MKATVERTPESEAVLTISLEWAELEKAADKAFQRLSQKYTVPGFRKGHAPRSMIERMLGKETIYQEGLEDLIESSYRDAIRENDLTPVAQPTIDAPALEMDQPYTYTARVAILTPPTLGDYTAIRVAAPTTEVSDEDVEHALEHMREDAAMWLPTERAAQVGDKVTANLTLTVDDKVVSDLHDNEFELAIERPGIFAGLDDHLVGMREGESAQFDTVIPEDYANPALAGKTGHYDVTLTAVKERELPELDDEFAKTMGDFDTLEALRAKLREQLVRQKESTARRELRDEVAKAATDQAEVTIHPALIADEVDAMLRETKRVLDQNRLSLETYLSMMQKSEAEYRTELEPEARERVKRDLVLGAVADAENIQVGEAELEDWLQVFTMLGGQRTRVQDLSESQRASVASRIRRDKALERLVEIATQGQAEPATATTLETQAGPQASQETPAEQEAQAGQQAAAQPVPQVTGAEMEQTLTRGAQEAARLGAELGGETPAASAAEAVEQPPVVRSSESAEPQALSGAGTEVPKPGA